MKYAQYLHADYWDLWPLLRAALSAPCRVGVRPAEGSPLGQIREPKPRGTAGGEQTRPISLNDQDSENPELKSCHVEQDPNAELSEGGIGSITSNFGNGRHPAAGRGGRRGLSWIVVLCTQPPELLASLWKKIIPTMPPALWAANTLLL